jgi:hypothetical protein
MLAEDTWLGEVYGWRHDESGITCGVMVDMTVP